MSIQFERNQRAATFNDPRDDFSTVDIPIEHRFDPLTNRSSRFVTSAVPPIEEPLNIESYVTDNTDCVFCPELVSSVTPTFVENNEGRRDGEGEAVCFPNITPYAEQSVVVVLTEDHHLEIDQITSELLVDGLNTAWNALETNRKDYDETYASINMNFYPSSGSSIVHPHLHGIADDVGTTEFRRFVERSEQHRKEHGESYWHTLVETELEHGERYIAREGCIDWVAAFAPKHFDHVFGIVDPDETGPENESLFEDAAAGIESVLAHYHESDFNSYNMSLYLPGPDHEMPPIVQLVARTPFASHYSSGVFFMQLFHDEGIFEVAPETYANEIAANF